MGVVLNTFYNIYYLFVGLHPPFLIFSLEAHRCVLFNYMDYERLLHLQKPERGKNQFIITIQLASSGSSPAQLPWLPISTEKGNGTSRKKRNNSPCLSASFYLESILILKRPFHPDSP